LLPKPFRVYEVQKLTEVGAINNLAHNVKDYVEANNPNRFRKNTQNAAFANVDSLYNVAYELNQNGNFDECIDRLDEIIRLNPTFEEAYWLRLCSKNHIAAKDMEYAALDFRSETDYISAITLAAPDKKKEYERICNECIRNKEGKETFHNKKRTILKEYEAGKRGKEKRKEIDAKEKKIRWYSDANAFFQAEAVTKKVVVGYVMFGITLLISFIIIGSAKADPTASSIYGVIDLMFMSAGILFVTDYLRRYWSMLLGFALFFLDILIPVFFENTMKKNGAVTGVILGLLVNIAVLALVTFLYVVFLMRRKKEEQAAKIYRAAFCEYTNLILDDVNKALADTVQERGRNMLVDYYPVKAVDSSNYMRMDQEIRQYLEKECMYVNLSNVFLSE
jgi:hypothetical protein